MTAGVTVAVVGGGITGLAAAWEAVRAGATVTVFEADRHLGGRIRTEEVAGRPVDLGPDAFLARVPHALELCRELGLGDELVHPATEGASVWTGGRLRPLPPRLVLGAPAGIADLARLVRSGLLTPAGAGRAALDLVLPATQWSPDPTVGEVVRARLGRQVFARVVDPLVGGIHAGPSERLSAQAAAPQLANAAASRSLIRGMRSGRAQGGGAEGGAARRPLFASLRTGLGRLVQRMEEELLRLGVVLQTGVAVDAVPVPGFDATVLTTPAPVTASLLAGPCPAAAADLQGVEYASVALVVLVYPADAVTRPLAGTGFLVDPAEGRLLTACSFASAKWPHWAGPGDVVLRASAGRRGDERALSMPDDALSGQLHAELVQAVGLAGEPRLARVTRWANSFPQYRPGHLERVARAEEVLARDLPGVILAGAAYRGMGIAACIAQGRAAARRAVAGASSARPA